MFQLVVAAFLQAPATHSPANQIAVPASQSNASEYKGSATVTCDVETDGRMTGCIVDEENPPRGGYGAATLKAVRQFKVKPAMRDGVPVRSKITLPIRWQEST